MKTCHLRKLSLLVVLLNISFYYYSCQSNQVDFAKDVAPIIHQNCSPCHRDNGGAPFSLITYEQIRKKAKTIVKVTQSGYMPPWPANPNYTHFIGEKILSEKDKNILKNWVKNNCPKGDLSSVKYPSYTDLTSQWGKPDMILNFPQVEISPNNKDQFLTLKLPYELAKEKYVKAIDFIPGIPSLVHHFNGHLFTYQDNKNVFEGTSYCNNESLTYTEDFDKMKLLNPDGSKPFRIHSAVNYLPGTRGVKYPENIGGFTMTKKGAYMAMDIHYGPSSKRLFDTSKLYLYFMPYPPKRPTYELMLGTNGVSKIVPPLVIKPHSKTQHFTEITVYNDISVLTINPHLHLLGTYYKAYAIKPNGDTIRLIEIPEWKFNWQYFYTFKNPVKIPKGSVIKAEAHFDNTNNNPNNPNNPPIEVAERLDKNGASMKTTDEMFQFIITYMPYQHGDENINLDIK